MVSKDRSPAQSELLSPRHRLECIEAVLDGLASAQTCDEAADTVAEIMPRALRARRAALGLRSGDGDGLVITRIYNAAWPRRLCSFHIAVSEDHALFRALKSRGPVIAEPRSFSDADDLSIIDLTATPGNTLIALPLQTATEPVGAILLSFASERGFSADEQGFLGMLARQCAVTLEHVRLLEQERAKCAELADSEAMYRQMVEFSPDAAFVHQDDKIVYVNKVFMDLLRIRSRDQIIGKPFSSFVHEDFRDRALLRSHRLENVGDFNPICESRWIAADGALIAIEVTAAFCHWEGRPAKMVIGRDVRKRVDAEQGLRRSEERFRSLAEATSLVIYASDSDGRLVEVNQAGLDFAGCTMDEIRGDGWTSLIHPEDLPGVMELWARAVSTRRHYNGVEYRLRRHDGVFRHFAARVVPVLEPDGSVREWIGACSDITDRKTIEEAVRKSEARLAEAQRVAQIGSWEYDPETGGVSWSNELCRIFQWNPAEGPPCPDRISESYHPDDRPLRDRMIGLALANGSDYSFDARIVVGGEIRWVNAVGRVVRDEDNRAARYVGTVMDITERKRAEEELARQKQELMQANTRLSEAIRRLEALATTDGLTDLKNHRAFQERLAEDCHRTTRYGVGLALIMLDIDNFKEFNDTFGHPAGDAVLKTVAQALVRATRASDFVARYGGEEFAIILPTSDGKESMAAAERYRRAIADIKWEKRPITASFGVSTFELGQSTPQALIDGADSALYLSKQRGRNCVSHSAEVESLRVGRRMFKPYDDLVQQIFANYGEISLNVENRIFDVLHSAYDDTVKGWATLLELRTKTASGAYARATDLITRLMRRLGMNEEEILYARWGALLHDVGKLAIPDHILFKEGPLTRDERRVFEQHPAIAYDMLSAIPFIRPALDIPYCCRERWNGAGYPRGLSGDEIPLPARLFAVVDAYDSLTTAPPHGRGWSRQNALRYIRKKAGTHFDPRAVDAFSALQETDVGLFVAVEAEASSSSPRKRRIVEH